VNKNQLRILIAPLDWGLGHVTRCMPIIEFIQDQGHKAIFAGNSSQQAYIKKTFTQIECLNLEGYNVQYSKTKMGLIPKIIAQIPRFKKVIKNEHLWLQSIVKTNKIDAIISDNRYGLYHSSIPCVIMTHQLQIKSGYSGIIDKILLKIHYKFIEKFKNCWVVDVKDEDGIGGSLSHPGILPKIQTHYIGLLSQLKTNNLDKIEDSYVLILLSGAEPQRTIFSNLLWKKAIKSDHHIIFVEGTENVTAPSLIPDHISYHKRLAQNDVEKALNAASFVICRSGYSTIMDLINFQKKAILVPTPGQTEQEYLSKRMMDKKIFMAANQNKFDIQTSLLNASLFPFVIPNSKEPFSVYKEVIKNWLKEIKK
jgi:uncharacterized protein (TIGR00661 family)